MEVKNKIKTLLVDDEFLALNLLEEFVKRIPELEVVSKVKSAVAAAEVLDKEGIDLMFLDIQMPQLSGTHFLKGLEKSPVTIFTTAYSDYAVEAFELDAVDYLLKPFSFERFLQAVGKAKKEISRKLKTDDFIMVKSDARATKILLDDILYVEGQKEYLKIICTEKKYIILDSFKHMEQILPADQFIRIHKSYMIAVSKITGYEGYCLMIGKMKIPMSRSLKKELIARIFNP